MAGPHVIDVTEATFQEQVVERSREVPVVVDFWAPWCAPCRTLGPQLERAAAEANGAWVLAKLNTDENQTLAKQFKIRGIPAVKGFRDGVEVAEFVGLRPPAQIREWLDALVPKGADPSEALLELAEHHLDAGRVGESETVLAQLPTDLSAPLALRRAALAFRLRGKGLDPVRLEEQLVASPADLEARWQLAHAHAFAGRWEEVLTALLEIVRRDRGFRDDGARRTMLEVFEFIGVRSPLADAWRRKLSMALY